MLEPERVVREVFEAYAAGDMEAVGSFYHPEAEIVGGPLLGTKGTYRGGARGLRELTERVDREFEEFEARAVAFRPGGTEGRVLVEGIVVYKTARRQGRGAWRSWWVFTVQEAKITRLEVFHDAAQGRKAAGLPAEG